MVSVIEQNVTNDLAEDDGADEPLVLGTDRVEFDAFGDVACVGEYHFNGLEIEVDGRAHFRGRGCTQPRSTASRLHLRLNEQPADEDRLPGGQRHVWRKWGWAT